MRRRMVVLFLLLLTIPMFAQQSRVDEIVSSIEPQKWYLGSAVQDAMRDLLMIQAEEQDQTSLETAEEAVKPHLIYETQLQEDLAAEKFRKKAWRAVGVAGIIAAIIATIVAVSR